MVYVKPLSVRYEGLLEHTPTLLEEAVTEQKKLIEKLRIVLEGSN